MDRKEYLQSLAEEHKSRGFYDTAFCKNGLERNIYAEFWEKVKCKGETPCQA